MSAGRYTRFVLTFLITGVGVLALIAMLNVAVDPYGFWGTPSIHGLSYDKPAQSDNEMLYKAAAVARQRPQIIILGSSRSDLALDPDHPALRARGTAYNLALLGGYMDATRDYYKYALSLQPAVRLVLLEANFWLFREKFAAPPTFVAGRLNPTAYLPDVASTTLTRDALFASVRTIAKNLGYPDYRGYSQAGLDFDDDMRAFAEAEGMPERMRKSLQLYSSYGVDFAVSKKAMADLREIVFLSRARGVDLRVFIPPEHVAVLEALRLSGLWCSWENWKAGLAALTPFVDFSGVNGITTEPIDRNMKLFWDAVHIRKTVGDMMLERLMGTKGSAIPAGFGTAISAETLPEWNQKQGALERQWRDSHPDVVKWIAIVLHSAGPPHGLGPLEQSSCKREQPIPAVQ